MINIEVYKVGHNPANISQTNLKRNWMENTADRHAYKCFPISMANTIGWSLSYDFDISFIWDGISDGTNSHVKVLKGNDVCNTNRGNGTISFDTGLIIKTDQNLSMLSIAPPNYFIDGVQAFTYLISTSFFEDQFPSAWKITKANEEIIIPAGTPIATLIPLSLNYLSDIEFDVYDFEKYGMNKNDYYKKRENYGKTVGEINMSGDWSNFYRNATNEHNEPIGSHETKSLKLKTNYKG